MGVGIRDCWDNAKCAESAGLDIDDQPRIIKGSRIVHGVSNFSQEADRSFQGVVVVLRVLLAVLLALICTDVGSAQTTLPLANVPGPNPIIFGTPVVCHDVHGAPVNFVFGSPGDLAKASLDPAGNPIMVFSLGAFSAPRPILLFVYAHECSHQMLGHIAAFKANVPPPPTMEPDADCNSATILEKQGLLSLTDITEVANFFSVNPKFSPYYPAGPVRAQHILDCYNAAAAGAAQPAAPGPTPY